MRASAYPDVELVTDYDTCIHIAFSQHCPLPHTYTSPLLSLLPSKYLPTHESNRNETHLPTYPSLLTSSQLHCAISGLGNRATTQAKAQKARRNSRSDITNPRYASREPWTVPSHLPLPPPQLPSTRPTSPIPTYPSIHHLNPPIPSKPNHGLDPQLPAQHVQTHRQARTSWWRLRRGCRRVCWGWRGAGTRW